MSGTKLPPSSIYSSALAKTGEDGDKARRAHKSSSEIFFYEKRRTFEKVYDKARETGNKSKCPQQFTYVHPGLHAAAKFAIFRVLTKNRNNRKVDDFSRSLAIFRRS